jgi:hypothetical protein
MWMLDQSRPRTLLNKLRALLLGFGVELPLTVVANAYYAASKFALALARRHSCLINHSREN